MTKKHFVLLFSLFRSTDSAPSSQVAPIFSSKTPSIEKPVDTPDLFKNVATSATANVAISRPTSGFGNPFAGSTATTTPQSLFGQPPKSEQPKTNIFGEPTAKKSLLDEPGTTNLFGSVKSDVVDRVKTQPSLFGEPAAKKTPLESNIFGAKISDNRLFSSGHRQTGSNQAVIPLFGKSSNSNF